MCDTTINGKVPTDLAVTNLGLNNLYAQNIQTCTLSAAAGEIDDLVVNNLTVLNTCVGPCGGGGGGGNDPHVWRHFPDTNNGTPTVQLDPAFPTYQVPTTLLFPTTTQDGASVRLAFNAFEGSLRAGEVTGTQWDTRGTNSVAFGLNNTVPNSNQATVAGGINNSILLSNNAFIGGGVGNIIDPSANSVVGGGEDNKITNSENASIMAGASNNIEASDRSSIAGGSANRIGTAGGSGGSFSSFIGAGGNNQIIDLPDVSNSFIGSGLSNSISNSIECGIMGGRENTITRVGAGGTFHLNSIVGGAQNSITQSNQSIVGGGFINNITDGIRCGVLSGRNNRIDAGSDNVIVGGDENLIVGATRSCIIAGRALRITGGTDNVIATGDSAYIDLNSSYNFIGSGSDDSMHIENSNFGILGSGRNHRLITTAQCGVFSGTGNTINNVAVDGRVLDSAVLSGNGNSISNSFGFTGPTQNTRNVICSGGGNNIDSSIHCGILAGTSLLMSGRCAASVILGGNNNRFEQPPGVTVGATNSLLGAGTLHRMRAVANAFILAGFQNIVENLVSNINADGEGILTGRQNVIRVTASDPTSSISNSVVVTGDTNQININAPGQLVNATNNVIVTGNVNQIVSTIAGTFSNNNILGGFTNTMTNCSNSLIGGGNNNSISSGIRSFILCASSSQVNTFNSGILSGINHLVSAGGSLVLNGSGNTVSGSGSIIGNGSSNTITDAGNFILNGNSQTINGRLSVILTGASNTVNITNALIGAGEGNVINGDETNPGQIGNCILVGRNNTINQGISASGLCTIVGGGSNTINTSESCTILAGSGNTITSGINSCAGGTAATVNHRGCFVWSDNTLNATPTTADNQFRVGCAGGADFFSNGARTTGVTLSAGGGAWAAISDRNAKENIVELDYKDVLDKVDQLPIYQYNYKNTSPGLVCRGPVAQDWHALFPSEKDPLKIDTMDLDGVSFAAIKGLLKLINQQQTIINQQQQDIDQLKQWMNNNNTQHVI